MWANELPSVFDCVFVKCLCASNRWKLLWRLCRAFQSESELQSALQTEEEEEQQEGWRKVVGGEVEGWREVVAEEEEEGWMEVVVAEGLKEEVEAEEEEVN